MQNYKQIIVHFHGVSNTNSTLYNDRPARTRCTSTTTWITHTHTPGMKYNESVQGEPDYIKYFKDEKTTPFVSMDIAHFANHTRIPPPDSETQPNISAIHCDYALGATVTTTTTRSPGAAGNKPPWYAYCYYCRFQGEYWSDSTGARCFDRHFDTDKGYHNCMITNVLVVIAINFIICGCIICCTAGLYAYIRKYRWGITSYFC